MIGCCEYDPIDERILTTNREEFNLYVCDQNHSALDISGGVP